MNDYLKSIYFDPSHEGSYSGVDKLYRAVKNDGRYNLSRGEIKSWLSRQRSYTAHKPIRRRFKRRRVIVDMKHRQYDADTVSMTRYSKVNDGYIHILILIDILSRYVWTMALKNLTGLHMVSALRNVFKNTKPRKLRTDRGSEFNNKHVKAFLKKENVEHFFTANETKANFSERVIKTLKSRITKYMDSEQTHRWLDILEPVTDSYNKTYHRSIKMSPTQALKTDDPTLWKIQYTNKKSIKRERLHPPKLKKPFRYKIGDQVKLSHMRTAFEKNYDEKWTGEIFFITSRKTTDDIPIYEIKSWNNKPIIGTFYEKELQKVSVSQNDVYNIEKIIKRRVRAGQKEVLVKWQSWPSEYNSWIGASELKDI